jgi:predicted GTPase
MPPKGVVGLDATIAGYAHEGGRAVIICVNKWDEVKGQKGQKKREFEQNIRDEFKFLDYAPIVFISARSGAGVEPLFKLIRECYESASRRITTGELNRFVEHLKFEERKIFTSPSTPSGRRHSRSSWTAAGRCTSRTSATWPTASAGSSVSRDAHPD